MDTAASTFLQPRSPTSPTELASGRGDGRGLNQLELPLTGLPPAPPPRVVRTYPPRTVSRFWARVVTDPQTGCRLFCGAVADDGYGRVWYQDGPRQRVVSAHRFAWELTQLPGTVIDCDLVLMHHCNTTLCVLVGPDHVISGTQRQNIRYADALGRRRGRSPMQDTSPAHRARWLRDRLLHPEHGVWTREEPTLFQIS